MLSMDTRELIVPEEICLGPNLQIAITGCPSNSAAAAATMGGCCWLRLHAHPGHLQSTDCSHCGLRDKDLAAW